MTKLASKYDHKQVEAGKYDFWLENDCFTADNTSSKEPFTIVIPPPNVTGKLHLGHAWDTSLQDIIIRMKRLQGFDALYLPGMDHAGIATQAKVEERLREQGISRYDLGREAFISKVWEWKEEYAATIRDQWRQIGLSLDYSRERFTLDEGLSKAVRKVFVGLYERGLIYRGKRIISWDPAQKTALSNIEVIYKDIEGAKHYFKYIAADNPDEYLEIMTTRPETIFGDGALAVNPKDERYKVWVGRKVIDPGNKVEIPVIADDYVDIDFGSGVVKITPAHDPNDYEVGLRHNVPQRVIMELDGTMSANEWVPKKYQGMDRFECRKTFLADMKEAGLLLAVEPYVHSVGHSERSGAIVEPYLSLQWFVKMDKLAEQAIANQNSDDKVKFYPDRFEGTFLQWMGNIQDWCISRQLWWGHQIPAWYNSDGDVYVGEEPPLDGEDWNQDTDVLDTWFSSALWPFSTLGWPEETVDYNRYFPTNALSTGYDIIFFWVSRMIFQSLEFTDQRPFNDVLIHGLIRAEDGRKMSKSLGNGIDPMDVIEQYGADSMRYFLVTSTSPGQDLRYSHEKLEATWNFINKIWNASRYVLMNTEGINGMFKIESLSNIDSWILTQLNQTIEAINYNADKYEFGEVGRYLYNFIWNDFCDWYIELSKPILQGDDEAQKIVTKQVLHYVLTAIVKLMHPFMPYVTEEIWQQLDQKEVSIMRASWPEIHPEWSNQQAVANTEYLMELIRGVRSIRKEYEVGNSTALPIIIKTASNSIADELSGLLPFIERFANPSSLTISSDVAEPEQAATVIGKAFSLFIPLADLVDLDAEREKLQAELKKLTAEIERGEKMLANPGFVNKAPEAKIAAEREKLEDYKQRYQTTLTRLESL
nr:valine--tRNA ligase [Culicoidibacter larvae]